MFGIHTSPLVLLNVLLALATYAVADNHAGKQSPSVIVLIPDGYGPALETFTREFSRVKSGSDEQWFKLAFDSDRVGAIQSKSANNLVTDSAAAGTAFACGVSTNNSFIGYDDQYNVCANVLEGAKAIGYNTGLVATSRITHATPAAYSSHVYNRDYEDLIAAQQLGNYVLGPQVDLLWGGGRRHFNGSAREDGRDLLGEAEGAGWNVITDRAGFDQYVHSVQVTRRSRFAPRENTFHLPSLGVFTSSHMSYEIDRDASKEPSLAEMAAGALHALDSHGKPFFLMIEASRIDHAGHANDPAAIAWDALAYEEAYSLVREWVDAHKGEKEYVVLATADHDTGGMVLPSGWDPKLVTGATKSHEFVASWLEDAVEGKNDDEIAALIKDEALNGYLGITEIEDEDLQALVAVAKNGTGVATALTEFANDHAGLHWGTGGHTEVDVSLYLYPHHEEHVGLKSVVGSHPNVWLGQWISEYLGLDLSSIKATLATQSDLGGEIPEAAPADE